MFAENQINSIASKLIFAKMRTKDIIKYKSNQFENQEKNPSKKLN